MNPTRSRSPVPRLLDAGGRHALEFLQVGKGVLSFFLIALVALVARRRTAAPTLGSLIGAEVHRAGWQLLPLTGFTAFILGLVLVGETITRLDQLGAQAFIGSILMTTVIRELGPLTVAVLVLARVGTANVIELAALSPEAPADSGAAARTADADPVRALIASRVLGTALAVFALSLFFGVLALAGGYAYAYVRHAALTPAEFVRQLLAALSWLDFLFLPLKTALYGAILAAVTCYHGLGRPLPRTRLPSVTARAVLQGIVGCLACDLPFLGLQWF